MFNLQTYCTIDAIIDDIKIIQKIDPKMEGRAKEFEAWFGTMYPICSKYAKTMVGKEADNASVDLMNKHTWDLMMASLSIWLTKMAKGM